jgi:riboflavin synthase
MFTGIITHRGTFKGYRRAKTEMILEAPGITARLSVGDSVSVNGVCLSVIRKDSRRLYFNLSRETLGLTTLGSLRPGREVNLELPLTPSSLLGGHLVSGHVDYRAKLVRAVPKPPGKRLILSLPPKFRPYIVLKGSVAVNGVSLTVAGVGPESFEVELIPVTLAQSDLGAVRAGDEVNVECDMIGKYVYNLKVPRNESE